MWEERRSRVTAFLLHSLTHATQIRYDTARVRFQRWCREQGLEYDQLPHEEQDLALSDFALSLRLGGESVQAARYTLATMQKDFVGRKYTTAWKVTSAWAKERPPHQVPPLPEEVANALGILLVASNHRAEGLAILLCFAGMLRISEALSLLWDDVVETPRGLIVKIRNGKTGVNQETLIANLSTTRFVGPASTSW